MNIIGIIHAPFKEKFCTPRQPSLVDTICELELLAPYNNADAVRGLDGFSHIWISFIFHQTAMQGWHNLVRPPRLGGNTKVGVFASRSNFRPNPIGLSLVELLEVKTNAGINILLRGADIIDGTPVIDIKPYIPFIESRPNAKSGFANSPPIKLSVIWCEQALVKIQTKPASLKLLIENILSQDPRPAYQNNTNRIYGVQIENLNIKFSILNLLVSILDLEEINL